MCRLLRLDCDHVTLLLKILLMPGLRLLKGKSNLLSCSAGAFRNLARNHLFFRISRATRSLRLWP